MRRPPGNCSSSSSSAPWPQATTRRPPSATSTWPGVPCRTSTRARHTFTPCPASKVLQPGKGSKARMRRSSTSAGCCQSMAPSALSILLAYVAPSAGCFCASRAPCLARSSDRTTRRAPSAARRSCSVAVVSLGPMSAASVSNMSPVSSPASICMMVMPVCASPASTARWIGAAPRQRGNNEPWMFRQPRRGSASVQGGRIRP